MKRIVSFLILLTAFIVILALPAAEAPTVHHITQPLPIRSILLYVGVVAVTLVAVTVTRREKTEEPEMSVRSEYGLAEKHQSAGIPSKTAG